MEAPGPWGPTVELGRSRRLAWRAGETVAALALLGIAMAAVGGAAFVRRTDANLQRVAVSGLAAPTSDARSFLVVGSDDRSGLTPEERAQYRLGDFTGRRSDVIIYVAISADRDAVTLVSLPRDLVVFDEDGRPSKLADNYAGGPDALVAAIQRTLTLDTNHYVEVSLRGFIDIVDTLGEVQVCFEEGLVDPKSGADFAAQTCYDFGPQEALSFVRSRQGSRADFERIERQQIFLRAVLREMTSARTLADPVRFGRIVTDVSEMVTMDQGMTRELITSLAGELLGVARVQPPMITLPSYPQRSGGVWYVVPYEPGARALIEDLRAGRVPARRATPAEARTVGVQVVSGGRSRGSIVVQSTLRFAGYGVVPGGEGPASLEAGGTTTVRYLPDHLEAATLVANALGAELLPLPAGLALPEGVTVLVAVGDDAAPRA